MLISRISLAALVLVAATGLAYGQQKSCPQKACPQKGCPPSTCDKCDTGCGGKGCLDLKPHFKTCGGEKQGCAVQSDTKVYTGNAYQCECQTVCLPKLAGCLSRGGLKDACGACGPCKSCEPAMPAKGGCGSIGCGDCGTRAGLFASLVQKGGGCVGLGKGGCEPAKGGECGKGPGPLDRFTCKPRVKKHLLVKKVDVCEVPAITCTVTGKGKGCGKGDNMGDGLIAPNPYLDDPEPPVELEAAEDAVEAAPEIPDPPPLNLGRALRGNHTSTRHTRNGLFELLLR
jgi:hypothetical protein